MSTTERVLSRTRSEAFYFAFMAALAAVAAVSVVYLSAADSKKLLAVAVACSAGVVAAYVSGNLRLLSLWALMLVIPLDLSKRFGTQFLKMGGESSFRAEISDVFLLILFAFQLLDIRSGRMPSIRVPRVTYRWGFLIVMGFLWVAFGHYQMTALHEVVRMLKLAFLFLVLTNELRTRERIVHCAGALTLGMLSEAIVGLIQYFTRKHLGLEALGETGKIAIDILAASTVQGEKVFRVGGFLSHPNVFGIFLAVLLPMAIGALMLRMGRLSNLFFLTSIGLGMAALIVTLSRSGWVSFAAAFVLLMFLMYLHPGLRRRSVLVIAGAALVLAITMIAFAGPIMNRIFSSREDAMKGRAEYIRDAWGMIKAKPILGWGLNSYVLAVPPFTQYGQRGAVLHYQGWIPPVHQIYYLWWSETGIIGLALHLWFLYGVIIIGVRNVRIRDQYLFTLNAACLAAMLAFLVDGFFSFSLRFNSILRVFWSFTAMMAAIHYLRLREQAAELAATAEGPSTGGPHPLAGPATGLEARSDGPAPPPAQARGTELVLNSPARRVRTGDVGAPGLHPAPLPGQPGVEVLEAPVEAALPEAPRAPAGNLGWRVLKNSAAQAVGRILVAILRLAVAGILVRSFGKELFGEYSLILGILTIADWLVDFGTTDVFVREYSRAPEDAPRLMRLLWAARCLQIPAAYAVMALLVVALQYPQHVQMAALIGGVNLLFFGGVLLYRVIFRSELEMEREVAAELISVACMVPMVAAVAQWRGGLEALMVCHVLSRALYFGLCLLFGRKRFVPSLAGVEWSKVPWVLRSSLAIGIIGFLVGGYETVDVLVLSKLSTLTDLAYYSAAQRMVWPMLMVLASVAGTFYPIYVSYWAHRRDDFPALCQRGLETVLVLAGAGVSVALAGAGFLMGLLGREMTEAAVALQVLAVLCFLKSITSTLGPVLYAVNAQNRALQFIGGAVALKAVVISLLAPPFGYMGVALGALAVEAVIGVIPTVYLVQSISGYRVKWRRPLLIAISTGLAGTLPGFVVERGGIAAAVLALLSYTSFALVSGCIQPAEVIALIRKRHA